MEFSGYLEVRTVSLVHITYVENFGGRGEGEREREREGGEGIVILSFYYYYYYFGCYENKRKQREVGIPPLLFGCLCKLTGWELIDIVEV